MEETFKMMKTLIEGYENTKSIEELIEEYQQKQNGNVLAYLFTKYYLMINRMANKYAILDTQDVASFALQELDKSIMRFNLNRQCSFVTFFYCVLNNRFKVEVNRLNTKSNIANYLIQDLPEYEEIIDTNFTFNSINDYGLTPDQYRLCNYLIDGYSSREIAKLLKVSHTTICNRVKKIGQIILG